MKRYKYVYCFYKPSELGWMLVRECESLGEARYEKRYYESRGIDYVMKRERRSIDVGSCLLHSLGFQWKEEK